MNKTFNDFPALMQAVIVALSENPSIKVDSQHSSYDHARDLIRVIISFSNGEIFAGEFPAEPGADIPTEEAAHFATAIRCFVKQQLALAASVAEQAHTLGWSVDHARRGQAH